MKSFLKYGLSLMVLFAAIFAINFLLGGQNITYMTQETYNGITIYRIHVMQYVKNIQTLLTEIPNNLALELQEREFNSDIVNNLKVIVNWLIFIANLGVWLFKLPFVVLKFILGFMGFEITQTIDVYISATNTYATIQNKWWLYTFIETILSYNVAYL